MSDGSYPGLVSKDRELNAVANPIFVELSQGGIPLADDNVIWVGISNLDGDQVTIEDGALIVSDYYVDDSPWNINSTNRIGMAGFIADEVSIDLLDENDLGAARVTLDRKQLMVIADPTTDSQRLSIDSTGAASVDLPLNTEINPVYVYQVNTVLSGNEVHDYDTAAAVASDATSDHDYTVSGTTFLLSSVIASGSGSVKFEIQSGPILSLVTVAVGFLTGRQGDTQQIIFDPAVEVPSTDTGTVRVIRTNRQGAATDVYSTIIGSDVA